MKTIYLNLDESFAEGLLCFLDMAEQAIKKEYKTAAGLAFAEGQKLRELLQEQLEDEDREDPDALGIWWLPVSKKEVDNLDLPIPEGLEPVDHLHVTLKFNVRMCDVPLGFFHLHDEGLPLIKVKGFAFNDKAACLVVEVNGWCDNEHPHITLALAEGVPPVYCNEMLAGVYSYKSLDFKLYSELEFYQFPNKD